jgi:Ricin-type beta-trefoil lectin domain
MRKARRFLTILAVPMLCCMTVMLGAPAMAATGSPPPGNGSFFQLESEVNDGLCAQEDGTTSSVYLGGCSLTNHSDLWYNPTNDIYEIANLHSGLCFSVTGDNAGVYLNTCVPGQTAQEWQAYGLDEIQNVHTGYCLWQSDSAIQQRNSCSNTNVHDLWLLL